MNQRVGIRDDDNHDRPHLALNRKPPVSYRARNESNRDRLTEPSRWGQPLPATLSQAKEPVMNC